MGNVAWKTAAEVINFVGKKYVGVFADEYGRIIIKVPAKLRGQCQAAWRAQ